MTLIIYLLNVAYYTADPWGTSHFSDSQKMNYFKLLYSIYKNMYHSLESRAYPRLNPYTSIYKLMCQIQIPLLFGNIFKRFFRGFYILYILGRLSIGIVGIYVIPTYNTYIDNIL